MKPSNLALSTLLFVSSSSTSAFTPPTYFNKVGLFIPSTTHIHPTISSRSCPNAPLSAYLGQDFDATPASSNNNDDSKKKEYVQKMTPDERKENLNVMKQIFKHDLADLRRRRDYAGWVEAKKDLKKRQAADPWFELNDLMREAIQTDELEEAKRLKKLIKKVSNTQTK